MLTPMQTLLKQTGHVMQTGERLGTPTKVGKSFPLCRPAWQTLVPQSG